MKLCTKCDVSKSLECFGKSKLGSGGKRSVCKACEAAYQIAFKKENPERVRESKKRWRIANLVKRAELQREWAKKNPNKVSGYTHAWRVSHKEQVDATAAKYRAANKEKMYAQRDKWRAENLAAHAASESKRRAVLRRGQPPWIKLYAKEMKKFYSDCRQNGLTADHIVPLQGKTVSGLHVPWNMQMLTLSENSRKRNKLTILDKIR